MNEEETPKLEVWKKVQKYCREKGLPPKGAIIGM